MKTLLLLGLAVLCAPPRALHAQSFNVDVTHPDAYSLPSSSYGAAANQPGAWTRVGSSQTSTFFSFALADLAGAATSARLDTFGGGPLYACSPCGGDFGALMGDGANVGGFWQGYPNGRAYWTFWGLLPGVYRVYTYAAAGPAHGPSQTWVEVPGSTTGPQVLSGVWTGSHALGVTYALHTITVGSSFTVQTQDPGQDATQRAKACGFQLEYLGPVQGVAYCAGDGSVTACPCGNSSTLGGGAGCNNSTGAGAGLRASGTPSIANDTIVLSAAGLPASGSALFFQGTLRENGGAGSVFGDGLRCTGGSITRLGIKTAAASQCSYPGTSDAPVSVRGAVTSPANRTYQVWYRNAAAFCTPATFNLTNGLELTWGA